MPICYCCDKSGAQWYPEHNNMLCNDCLRAIERLHTARKGIAKKAKKKYARLNKLERRMK